MKVIDDKHPRKKVYDEKNQKEVVRSRGVCATKTGCHNCCSRQSRSSELSEYGVGAVLYFQFLKCMGCLFLLMALLAIPAMLFFFFGTELADTSLTKIVAAASLGNLGSSSPVCKDAKFDLISEQANKLNPQVNMQLSCPFGELFSIKQFGQMSISTVVDCEAAQDDPDNANFEFYPHDCSY